MSVMAMLRQLIDFWGTTCHVAHLKFVLKVKHKRLSLMSAIRIVNACRP
jgi:hypothetical protein